MTGPVLAKTYPAPSVDRKILRYMGCHCGRADETRKTDSALENMVDECLSELLPQLTYNVCYRQFTIHVDACNCNLSFMQTDSRALAGALAGCERLVVFAATIGLAPDRLISKYGRLSPARALCFRLSALSASKAYVHRLITILPVRFGRKGILPARASAPATEISLSQHRKIFFVSWTASAGSVFRSTTAF